MYSKHFMIQRARLGYSFNIKGKIFTIITDTGIINEEMEKFAEDSDFLFLEANYCPEMLQNGPYPWFLKKKNCVRKRSPFKHRCS